MNAYSNYSFLFLFFLFHFSSLLYADTLLIQVPFENGVPQAPALSIKRVAGTPLHGTPDPPRYTARLLSGTGTVLYSYSIPATEILPDTTSYTFSFPYMSEGKTVSITSPSGITATYPIPEIISFESNKMVVVIAEFDNGKPTTYQRAYVVDGVPSRDIVANPAYHVTLQSSTGEILDTFFIEPGVVSQSGVVSVPLLFHYSTINSPQKVSITRLSDHYTSSFSLPYPLSFLACGDGVCSSGESPIVCPMDCSACNANGICEPIIGENSGGCPSDCTYAPPAVCGATNGIPFFGFLFSVGVIISACILGILFIIAALTDSPEGRTWVHEEFYQLFMLAFFLLFVFYIFSLGCSRANIIPFIDNFATWAGFNKNTFMVYDAAGAYLDRMTTYTYSVFRSITDIIGKKEYNAYRMKYVCGFLCVILGNGYTSYPGAGEHSVIGAYQTVLHFSLLSLFNTLAFRFLLEMIETGALLYLVPLGIVIRTLPGMRSFGGSLLGASLALYVFLPLFFLISGILFHPTFSSLSITESTIFEHAGYVIFGGIFLPTLSLLAVAAIGRDLSIFLGGDINLSRLAYML